MKSTLFTSTFRLKFLFPFLILLTCCAGCDDKNYSLPDLGDGANFQTEGLLKTPGQPDFNFDEKTLPINIAEAKVTSINKGGDSIGINVKHINTGPNTESSWFTIKNRAMSNFMVLGDHEAQLSLNHYAKMQGLKKEFTFVQIRARIEGVDSNTVVGSSFDTRYNVVYQDTTTQYNSSSGQIISGVNESYSNILELSPKFKIAPGMYTLYLEMQVQDSTLQSTDIEWHTTIDWAY